MNEVIADPRQDFLRLVKRRKREHQLSIACGIIYALAVAGYVIWLLV